jgi:Uncharacterised nucleotidyltransferase
VRDPGLAEAWGGVRAQRDIWPTPEQERLLCAAILADERALSAWSEIRGQLELPDANSGSSEELPRALDGAAHALLPALYRNLSALGSRDPLLEVLQSAHRSIWLRNQMLLRRVLPGLADLGRAGIPTMLIKGAALIASGRFDSGVRSITDVDVVVPTAQLDEAIDVLMQGGFRPVGKVPPWYVRDYAGRFVPSHAFASADNSQIDLHWHVLHASCQPDADEDFWAASAPVELAGLSTAALCATDELLLAILHGLRWSATPTYRWVLDAAQLARGDYGEIDFERLLAQARRRRVTATVRAGLAYLCRVVDAPIPSQTLSGLARAPLLERLELRAQVTDPRARGRPARSLLHHQQHLRRALALGRRATLREHVRLGRDHLGLRRLRDVRLVLRGGTPGPGRPPSTVAASLGTGSACAPVPCVALDQPLALGDPELMHRHVRYGTWLPEADACWTAGSQARISLRLDARAAGPLLLGLWLDAYLPAPRGSGRQRRHHRQRLRVAINGSAVGAVRLDRARPGLDGEAFVIARSDLTDGRDVELVLATPDAASPAELGIAPDDRLLGVSIRRLVLRRALEYSPGQRLRFGERSGDERVLAGGWCNPQQDGRWTYGARSSVLLTIADARAPLDVELEAEPFLGRAGRPLKVTVLANGRRIGALRYRRPVESATVRRVALPLDALGPDGELLLTFAIQRPSSPAARGLSQDARPLGLFVRALALVPRV